MRSMVIEEERLHELLTLALAPMQVSEDCAAVLEGSIAEGFGNSSSDVDFLLLDDSEEVYAGTPTVLFVDGWRVEVRIRSTREVREDRDALWRLAREPARIPDDLLNRCQRLAHAFPLRGRELVARVQGTLPCDELNVIAARAFAHRSRQSGRLAVAMAVLGDHDAAATSAETALTYGAKAWAALRGETYVETKWLTEQLLRVQAHGIEDAKVAERCCALLTRSTGPEPEEYARRALAMLPQLGVAGCAFEPTRVYFRRQPGVTTWPIDGRLHVLRDGDVFLLDDAAARAWRGVVFERPLPAVLGPFGGTCQAHGVKRPAGFHMAAFYRLGLVRLGWRGGGMIAPAPAITSPPTEGCLPLSLSGARQVYGDSAIALVPLPARRFAAAGMALVWNNVMVENAREDAIGALAHGQWGVLTAVVRRMLLRACLALLSAHGVDPLPSQEEACARIAELPSVDRAVARDTIALEHSIAIDGPSAGRELLTAVERLVVRLRAAMGAASFPQSFGDAEGWRATLETFYDWVRLGANLDADFPLEDLRDVLLSVDQRRGPTATAAGPRA